MTFEQRHAAYSACCEDALKRVVEHYFEKDSKVSQAAEYGLLNGGKRVRGVLVLAVCDLLEGDVQNASSFAAAIEMIHAFSLIHDDLPCMDDDDMRRGKPATHIAFGEANALLAGDMLAIEALHVLTEAAFTPDICMRAVACLSAASGAKGMILGQELDLRYEQEAADESALHRIHAAKTGALIRASAELGILAAEKNPQTCPEILRYADNLGLSFQIVDDVLDIESTSEVLGKPVGSDAQNNKTTFVSLYGIDRSRAQVEQLTEQGVAGLRHKYGETGAFLSLFAQRLAARAL